MSDFHLSNLTNCKMQDAKREVTWWNLIFKEVWWSASTLTRSKMSVVLSRDTSPQLWIKLHRNQPNLLFIRSSIHLTDHVEMIENNPENCFEKRFEIRFNCWDACNKLHDWNAAASRDRKLEKSVFASSNLFDISDYSIFHKALNLNLSRLHRSSSSDF
jgi:hypothetical protein